MSKDTYTPSEFRECARLRGIARCITIDRYMLQERKQEYTENDFIACYRLEDMAQEHETRTRNVVTLDVDGRDWDEDD